MPEEAMSKDWVPIVVVCGGSVLLLIILQLLRTYVWKIPDNDEDINETEPSAKRRHVDLSPSEDIVPEIISSDEPLQRKSSLKRKNSLRASFNDGALRKSVRFHRETVSWTLDSDATGANGDSSTVTLLSTTKRPSSVDSNGTSNHAQEDEPLLDEKLQATDDPYATEDPSIELDRLPSNEVEQETECESKPD